MKNVATYLTVLSSVSAYLANPDETDILLNPIVKETWAADVLDIGKTLGCSPDTWTNLAEP